MKKDRSRECAATQTNPARQETTTASPNGLMLDGADRPCASAEGDTTDRRELRLCRQGDAGRIGMFYVSLRRTGDEDGQD